MPFLFFFCASLRSFDCLLCRYALVIGLENSEKKGEPPVPTLDYRFPPTPGKSEGTGTIESILLFCWPDVDTKKVRKKKKSRPKTFRFVLTEADGAKKFGYCLRSLPDVAKAGKKKRFAECICIVSKLPCFALFDPLLHLIESRRNNGTRSDVFVLLQSIRARSMPLPGQVRFLHTLVTLFFLIIACCCLCVCIGLICKCHESKWRGHGNPHLHSSS